MNAAQRLDAAARAVIEEEEWPMPAAAPGLSNWPLGVAPVVSPVLSPRIPLPLQGSGPRARPRTPSPRPRRRRRIVRGGGGDGGGSGGGASGSAGSSQVLVDRSTLHTLANTCVLLYDAIWDLLEPQDASSTPGS